MIIISSSEKIENLLLFDFDVFINVKSAIVLHLTFPGGQSYKLHLFLCKIF